MESAKQRDRTPPGHPGGREPRVACIAYRPVPDAGRRLRRARRAPPRPRAARRFSGRRRGTPGYPVEEVIARANAPWQPCLDRLAAAPPALRGTGWPGCARAHRSTLHHPLQEAREPAEPVLHHVARNRLFGADRGSGEKNVGKSAPSAPRRCMWPCDTLSPVPRKCRRRRSGATGAGNRFGVVAFRSYSSRYHVHSSLYPSWNEASGWIT